ncbi:hypothetical protein CCYA_CCYA14G3700 [Cyanidiococcus yangmingshanensis]|nr:hypothetical protein CCYA_CCYA14G3700 [Cyanidiococcus yangmingshanensis]
MTRGSKRKHGLDESAGGATKQRRGRDERAAPSTRAARQSFVVQPFSSTLRQVRGGLNRDEPVVESAELRDQALYRFRSPPIGRTRTGPNELFLSGGCRFVGILERARRLLFDVQHEKIILHAVGRAMERAIRASLVLIDRYEGWLTCSVYTSSVPIVDEYEPQRPDLPWIRQTRIQSAIHIHLIRTKKLPAV